VNLADYTDSSGLELVETYLGERRPTVLVFTAEEEARATAAKFEWVYVHPLGKPDELP
jgi:hypothetical protein